MKKRPFASIATAVLGWQTKYRNTEDENSDGVKSLIKTPAESLNVKATESAGYEVYNKIPGVSVKAIQDRNFYNWAEQTLFFLRIPKIFLNSVPNLFGTQPLKVLGP